MKKLFASMLILAFTPVVVLAQAPTVLTNGHVDFLSIQYEGSVLSLGAAYEAPDAPNLYTAGSSIGSANGILTGGSFPIRPFNHNEGNGVVFNVGGAVSLFNRPAGSEWEFIGVGTGQAFRATPESAPAATHLQLGVSNEDITTGIFNGDSFAVGMRIFSAPGQFSMYSLETQDPNSALGSFGTNGKVYLTTTTTAGNLPNSGSPGPLLTNIIEQHIDLNVAFSQPGTYQVDFQLLGTLTAGNVDVYSDIYRYTFNVAAVPEPASIVLGSFAVSGAGFVFWRRRRSQKFEAEIRLD